MDLVTFGEALVRLSPQSHRPLDQARSFDAHVGGAELNVAVAATRLGTPARWVSRLPENALGRMIESRAREQGVDTRIEWTSGGRVGLYFLEQGSAPRQTGVLYDRAGSAFSGIAPGTVDWASVLRGARWFHVSGITPALSETAASATAEALKAAKDAGLTVSYDVNYRVKLWSAEHARATHKPLMQRVDVLVATEDDARTVFAVKARSPDEIARELVKRFDVGAVAITVRESKDGCGAVIATGESIYTAPRHDVEVVDRVGAGDAFTAGLIVSRLENRGWNEAVRFATALAAMKLQIAGDFCTATRADVDRILQRAHSGASR